VAYSFLCDWKSGFVPDPAKTQRAGYLVSFNGLGMGEFLKQDLEVFSFFDIKRKTYDGITLDATGKLKCTGIIESFTWNGGVGDPLCISAYISAENGEVLKAKMKSTLSTTKIDTLAWWITNFDVESKLWYEEAFPKTPLTVKGMLNAPGGKDIRLQVADQATKVAANIDVNVYNVYFEIVPGANAIYALHFATSAKTKVVRNWGFAMGSSPGAALGV
jgi:hypothetical protein